MLGYNPEYSDTLFIAIKQKQTDMKKIFVILSVLIAGVMAVSAQTKYLVNMFTPVESRHYKAYKYTGESSRQIAMSGGLKWYGGFTIGHTVGPYNPGYATFKLGGKYEHLMFVLGHEDFNTGSGGTGFSTDPRIVTVYADGRKVVDELVFPYGLPKRITLNIKGVDEVKFVLVSGEGYIGFAEATLWSAGEKPVETGNLITRKPKTIELVKDLKPYFQNYLLKNVSPTDKCTAVKINGQEYSYGLSANMDMAIIGNNPGWAYFNLRKQYSKLSFIVGPADNTENHRGTGWITVKADGKIIHEQHISYADIAQKITLDITGCEMLSFHSEQETGSTSSGIVRIMAYPEGVQPASEEAGLEATVDPRLKNLPDVCKLISNIPPYAAGALTQKQIYDGTSDYITFSMGGEKFNEGIILYEKVNVLSNNTSAYAVFDLGNEFDYVSFTAGYIGKSGAMNNDVLRVYADDKLVLETPMIATYPNQHYTVPLNRCRKLRFENQGSPTLDVAAFGIADIVVYRGKPVANNLFVHPKPECPHTIDLIDLGAPYIHYVAPMSDHKDEIFYDGSTQRKYFDLNGTHINKGFMLQTSVHFSLDHGVLSGSDGAAASVIGGAAVGSAFVASGIAIGGAVVGSTLIGAAAFLMLAAGGEALENSLAAFSTYGEYNSMTFTVACYKPHITKDEYKETLLIGADHQVVAEIALYETMEPQTITVPIDRCQQVMFWLSNTDNWSGQYIFYDIKLTKDRLALDIPKPARLSQPVITPAPWSEKPIQNTWERIDSSWKSKNVDGYLRDLSIAYEQMEKLIKDTKPLYEIRTYYLESDAGQYCKAVTLKSTRSENLCSIPMEYSDNLYLLEKLTELKKKLNALPAAYAQAMTSLPELGADAATYGKALSRGNKVMKECKKLTEQMYQEKLAETQFLKTILDTAIDIDGKQSTEKTVLCPLFKGETPPSTLLQLVKHFEVK